MPDPICDTDFGKEEGLPLTNLCFLRGLEPWRGFTNSRRRKGDRDSNSWPEGELGQQLPERKKRAAFVSGGSQHVGIMMPE